MKSLVLLILVSLSFCVAAKEERSRFKVEGSTVLDEQTGLRWQRCSVGQVAQSDNTCKGMPQKFNFLQAQKQTNFTIRTDGFWRVPTKNELASLVDTAQGEFKIDRKFFLGISEKNHLFWSCDIYDDGAAWYVDFRDGYVGYMSGDHSSADDLLAVRLVHVER